MLTYFFLVSTAMCDPIGITLKWFHKYCIVTFLTINSYQNNLTIKGANSFRIKVTNIQNRLYIFEFFNIKCWTCFLLNGVSTVIDRHRSSIWAFFRLSFHWKLYTNYGSTFFYNNIEVQIVTYGLIRHKYQLCSTLSKFFLF